MTAAPGKSYRTGISLTELAEMFPDEQSAVDWFESIRWRHGRHCPYCGCDETTDVPNRKPMPYWCSACRSYFSVRTGTTLQNSRLPLRKWAFAVYLFVTNLKGVSSMKLHRDLKITQKTAWFMLHRLRESWSSIDFDLLSGPVEADETYIGGKEGNKHAKRKLKVGRGTVGKTAVADLKDRKTGQVVAKTVEKTDAETLQGFVTGHTVEGAQVYTDDAKAYVGIDRPHEAVKHSVGEYVRDQAHTNGLESFWASMKRGYHGTYHHMSVKHLERYVAEFSGRHNVRPRDTIHQMMDIVAGMIGKQLSYRDLTN